MTSAAIASAGCESLSTRAAIQARHCTRPYVAPAATEIGFLRFMAALASSPALGASLVGPGIALEKLDDTAGYVDLRCRLYAFEPR